MPNEERDIGWANRNFEFIYNYVSFQTKHVPLFIRLFSEMGQSLFYWQLKPERR